MGTVGIQARVASSLCERVLSNRNDGQNREILVNTVMMIVLIVELYMTWTFKMNRLVDVGMATGAV